MNETFNNPVNLTHIIPVLTTFGWLAACVISFLLWKVGSKCRDENDGMPLMIAGTLLGVTCFAYGTIAVFNSAIYMWSH